MKWALPLLVFACVLTAQLFLIARIGTDIPFQDQWDVEGPAYAKWRDGNWRAADLLRAHNEHRILWTRLLNQALFSVNGQWDPLVQQSANAVIRAFGAAALGCLLARGVGGAGGWLVFGGVVLAYLPHVAWQNALWGFQSSFYFVLLFSFVALAWLGAPQRSRGKLAGGLVAGVAALLALGAGVFVPVALLGLATLHAVERRRWDPGWWRESWPALVLLALAWALRTTVPAHAALHASTPAQFFNAFLRALAWPHTWLPAAAIVLNLPLLIAVAGRVVGWRRPGAGEDFVLLLGGWTVTAAAAMAWTRGGGHEFDFGVTIRYVDFLVLLPIANAWCAIALARETTEPRRRFARVLAGSWAVFFLVGWLGLSSQIMRGFILPRMHDRDAPIRLAVAFQRSGDVAVFANQPPILVPHPNAASVSRVLNDPRMRGALPPSFQPTQPLGPLSRAVRFLLRREGVSP